MLVFGALSATNFMKRIFLSVLLISVSFAMYCLGQGYGITSVAAATSGSIGAGYCEVTFVTSSDWNGTINGVAFPASQRLCVGSVNDKGHTLENIAFTRSAGTLYITKTRCQ